MSLKRRDLEYLAKMVRDLQAPPAVKRYLAHRLSAFCVHNHSRFDQRRFHEACGAPDDAQGNEP